MACQTIIPLLNSTLTVTGQGSSIALPAKLSRWVALITGGAVTGTNPTLDLKIQHSADGTNWVDLISFTQITASSAVEYKFAAAATDYLKPLLPFARANYTIGGTASPTFNSIVAKLLLDY
jgi:hypothetical protein